MNEHHQKLSQSQKKILLLACGAAVLLVILVTAIILLLPKEQTPHTAAYVREGSYGLLQLPEGTSGEFAGTGGAARMQWSGDGRWLYYVTGAENGIGTLSRISADGTAQEVVARDIFVEQQAPVSGAYRQLRQHFQVLENGGALYVKQNGDFCYFDGESSMRLDRSVTDWTVSGDFLVYVIGNTPGSQSLMGLRLEDPDQRRSLAVYGTALGFVDDLGMALYTVDRPRGTMDLFRSGLDRREELVAKDVTLLAQTPDFLWYETEGSLCVYERSGSRRVVAEGDPYLEPVPDGLLIGGTRVLRYDTAAVYQLSGEAERTVAESGLTLYLGEDIVCLWDAETLLWAPVRQGTVEKFQPCDQAARPLTSRAGRVYLQQGTDTLLCLERGKLTVLGENLHLTGEEQLWEDGSVLALGQREGKTVLLRLTPGKKEQLCGEAENLHAVPLEGKQVLYLGPGGLTLSDGRRQTILQPAVTEFQVYPAPMGKHLAENAG